jgi:RimJ/RimL family protein N-acetyltransferase
MPASGHTVELVTTKEIELFLPTMKELADDFGDRFLLAMLHWCGIGSRPAPLEFWQVFLIRTLGEIVGISGLYRQPESPAQLCWLGWFAVRPKFRRKGFGSAAIHATVDCARTMGCKELWVYTGASDEAARHFYTKVGFELLGSARDSAPGKTIDDSDIVLKLRLDVSKPEL